MVLDLDVKVHEVLVPDPIFFYTEDAATDAVQAFERYDIITAPVVNLHDRVVGMITVDAVMDYRRETTERDRLRQVGLNRTKTCSRPSGRALKSFAGGAHGGGGAAQLGDRIARGRVYTAWPAMAGP